MEKRKKKKERRGATFEKKQRNEVNLSSQAAILESSSCSEIEDIITTFPKELMNAKEENDSDPEFPVPTTSTSKAVKRRARNIVTDDLSGTLDRVALSDRKATQVLAACCSF